MKLFLWRFFFHLKYHFWAFMAAIQNEWRLYRQIRKIPGLNVEISKNVLDMATEVNGVNKYPTPSDMRDSYSLNGLDLQINWTEKEKNYPKDH